jgi:hypothetical protein
MGDDPMSIEPIKAELAGFVAQANIKIEEAEQQQARVRARNGSMPPASGYFSDAKRKSSKVEPANCGPSKMAQLRPSPSGSRKTDDADAAA